MKNTWISARLPSFMGSGTKEEGRRKRGRKNAETENRE